MARRRALKNYIVINQEEKMKNADEERKNRKLFHEQKVFQESEIDEAVTYVLDRFNSNDDGDKIISVELQSEEPKKPKGIKGYISKWFLTPFI